MAILMISLRLALPRVLAINARRLVLFWVMLSDYLLLQAGHKKLLENGQHCGQRYKITVKITFNKAVPCADRITAIYAGQ